MIWLIYFHLWPQAIIFTTGNSLCTIYNSIVLSFNLQFNFLCTYVLIPKSNCNLFVGSTYMEVYFGLMFIPSDQKIWHWFAQNFFKIYFGGRNGSNKTWKFFLIVWIQLRKASKKFINSICFFKNWLFLWMSKM